MTRGKITSIVSPLLAFLASQHHALMMLFMAGAVGGAGMSFAGGGLAWVRRAMLAMSLVLAGLTTYRLWRRSSPVGTRWMGAVSVGATLALTAWSVAQFGL